MAIAAIAIAVTGAVSYFMPCFFGQRFSDHSWLVLFAYDGRARIFWINSTNEPIKIGHRWGIPSIYILPKDAYWPMPPTLDRNEMGPQPVAAWQARINIGGYRNVDDFDFKWKSPIRNQLLVSMLAQFSYVRFPIWIPAVALIIAPIRAAIRGPIIQRRRKKRGACIHCGYNLTGNTTGVCSECGEVI